MMSYDDMTIGLSDLPYVREVNRDAMLEELHVRFDCARCGQPGEVRLSFASMVKASIFDTVMRVKYHGVCLKANEVELACGTLAHVHRECVHGTEGADDDPQICSACVYEGTT